MFNINFVENLQIRIGDLNLFQFFKQKYNKENVKLLFVDDDDMPIADNLRKSKWNVKKIKNIKDIDCDDVVSRQIIFVDYEGVGRSISSKHQGAGLVKELKEKYGKTKYVVLYTSEKSLPSDTLLKSYFDYADDRLPKDADELDFVNTIQKAFSKLK